MYRGAAVWTGPKNDLTVRTAIISRLACDVKSVKSGT